MDALISCPVALHSSVIHILLVRCNPSSLQISRSLWTSLNSFGAVKMNISDNCLSSFNTGAYWSLQMHISGRVNGNTFVVVVVVVVELLDCLPPAIVVEGDVLDLRGALMMLVRTSSAFLLPSTPSIYQGRTVSHVMSCQVISRSNVIQWW